MNKMRKPRKRVALFPYHPRTGSPRTQVDDITTSRSTKQHHQQEEWRKLLWQKKCEIFWWCNSNEITTFKEPPKQHWCEVDCREYIDDCPSPPDYPSTPRAPQETNRPTTIETSRDWDTAACSTRQVKEAYDIQHGIITDFRKLPFVFFPRGTARRWMTRDTMPKRMNHFLIQETNAKRAINQYLTIKIQALSPVIWRHETNLLLAWPRLVLSSDYFCL